MASLKILQNPAETQQRLHASAPKSGHIYKKSSSVAPFCTIPSKYETYIIENQEKRGFNSTSLRFNYEQDENELPGVGYYTNNDGNQAAVIQNPSLSRKGTGSFASKATRKNLLTNQSANRTPAPNQYHPISLASSMSSKKDFSQGQFSSNFQPRIAASTSTRSLTEIRNAALPAPNAYNINSNNQLTHQPSASFLSKTNRNSLMASKQTAGKPGPGQYSIHKADHILSTETPSYGSVFRSKTKRGSFYKSTDGPGPSEYNIDTAASIDKLNRDNAASLPPHKHHYLCLAAKALPLPATPAMPGPGHYQVSTRTISPHFMSSSMFLSTSTRVGGPVSMGIGIKGSSGTTGELPGPGEYQPTYLNKKQSFHYNTQNRWM